MRKGYRNPSAKAPVIHPGDEAPFLGWRGEGVHAPNDDEMLDKGGRACYAWNRRSRRRSVRLIGTQKTKENQPPKQRMPTFLLELPLQVEAGQAKRLRAHLEAARQFYNAVLSTGQTRLRRMQAD